MHAHLDTMCKLEKLRGGSGEDVHVQSRLGGADVEAFRQVCHHGQQQWRCLWCGSVQLNQAIYY